MTVIDDPHVVAQASCVACGKEYICVRPLKMTATSGMECPECGEMASQDNGPIWLVEATSDEIEVTE